MSAMRVRVATLNAWAMPGPLGEDVELRMGAIGEELGRLDVDVAAFQELWTAGARAPLVEAGRRAGLAHVWQPNAWVGGGGLLVLSRLPIEHARFERFALRGHPERLDQGEYWSGKGFAALRLELAEGRVTFVDTHLHARYNHDAPHRYRPHRTAQLVQLVSGALRTPDPVIVTGDLNFEEGDDDYRVMLGLTGLRDVAAELDRRQPTVLNTNPYRPGMRLPSRRIDFVLARDGRERGLAPRVARRVFDRQPDTGNGTGDGPLAFSNHAGVLAELELTAAPRPPAAPDPAACALALDLIAEGRRYEQRRNRELREQALLGAGSSALAVSGAGVARVTRRRFMERGLQWAAVASLAPGAVSTLLAESAGASEVRAFDQAAAVISRIGPS